jgi:hypothetical protein
VNRLELFGVSPGGTQADAESAGCQCGAGELEETSSADIHKTLSPFKECRGNISLPRVSFPSAGGKAVSSRTHRPPLVEVSLSLCRTGGSETSFSGGTLTSRNNPAAPSEKTERIKAWDHLKMAISYNKKDARSQGLFGRLISEINNVCHL